MWDVIKTIITSPAGSFAFVAAILYAVGWAIHKISKATTTVDMKMQKVDKLESNLDGIKEDIQWIKANLSVIQVGKGSLTKSKSPVSLTPLGTQKAEEMKIMETVAKYWASICKYLDAKLSDANAYDIQQFCIETATINLDKIFPKEEVDRIKLFAFNEGNPVAYYGGMIGVIIRDKYFEVKGINIAEVDANAPRNEN